MTHYPTRRELEETAERLKPHVRRTPVVHSRSIDKIMGAKIYFKCENCQKVGAFKFRGAMNAVLFASTDDVVAHSSGNHAQAVARAARERGKNAHIVIPRTGAPGKIEATRGYGARVVLCENTQESREETARAIVEETNGTLIHPFNDHRIILGQGTAAMELFEDHGDLDAVFTPVSGGGLLSGTALAAQYFSERTRVYAGEPGVADDAHRSLKSGTLQENTQTPNTIADGLLSKRLGEKTWAIIKERVEDIFTVTDEEILMAQRMVMERTKQVIEASSAVAVAALYKHREQFRNQEIGIIISGGNIDFSKLAMHRGRNRLPFSPLPKEETS